MRSCHPCALCVFRTSSGFSPPVGKRRRCQQQQQQQRRQLSISRLTHIRLPPFTSNTSVSTASTALSTYRSLHASTISSDAAISAYWNDRATELLTWDHYPYGPADLV
jgi:hypothetical protein